MRAVPICPYVQKGAKVFLYKWAACLPISTHHIIQRNIRSLHLQPKLSNTTLAQYVWSKAHHPPLASDRPQSMEGTPLTLTSKKSTTDRE